MEFHAKRYYLGWKCGHCDLRNTVVDCYRFGIEGNCLSCARPFSLPPYIQVHYKKMWRANV